MPTRETPSYSSSRVQRASRLNALEQVRLQQKLMLLEKARLHQARLTNQDIRLTSLALDYILACSGNSPEGRGPQGQQGGIEVVGPQEEPCFLYGERVVSRKVRRVARPQSAVERATFRRTTQHDASSIGSGADESASVRDGLPPRPQSSPVRRRPMAWSSSEEDVSDLDSERPQSRGMRDTSPGVSRPSTGAGVRAVTPCSSGRVTPHQPWEDDTDEVTRRLLKAQQQQQQRQQELQQREEQRRSQRYRQDLERRRGSRRPSTSGPSGSRGAPGSGYFRYSRTSPNDNRPVTAASTSSSTAGHTKQAGPSLASPASPSWSQSRPTSGHAAAVIEDRKPVSPAEKHAQSGVGRRAGLTEILSQSRVTMSAGAWRAHLTSTPTVPRSTDAQRQLMMEARKGAERERQQHVMQKVETFMDQLLDKKHF